MARPREPSRSAAAGAGGVSTAGWSRPASAHRHPRGPTREYPSAAERGGRDLDRDPLSAAPFRLPGGARRPGPAEPGPAGLTGSRASTAGRRSPTAGLGQKERPPGLGPRESNPELPGGRGPYCVRMTRSGPVAGGGCQSPLRPVRVEGREWGSAGHSAVLSAQSGWKASPTAHSHPNPEDSS